MECEASHACMSFGVHCLLHLVPSISIRISQPILTPLCASACSCSTLTGKVKEIEEQLCFLKN